MSVVVTGYASLDYAVRLDRPPRPDTTATILSRPDEWPRLGGSPAYVAAALVAGGVRDAIPISWVADDADGARYRAGLARAGFERTESPRVPDERQFASSPISRTAPVIASMIQGSPNRLNWTRGTARARRGRRMGLSDDRTRRGYPGRPRGGPAGRQGRLGRQGRCAGVPADLAAAIASRADLVAFSRGEAEFVAKARVCCEQSSALKS